MAEDLLSSHEASCGSHYDLEMFSKIIIFRKFNRDRTFLTHSGEDPGQHMHLE